MEPGADTRAAALGWPLRALPGLSFAQRVALDDVWRAFWLSRALVWLVGMAAVLALGAAAQTSPRLDSLFLTVPFDTDFANLLVSPAARFDASWYLEIATFGYDVQARAAFFPLYPGLIALLAPLTGSPLIAGIALSLVCSLAGMYLLHRLVSVDHPQRVAQATIWIVAVSPAAICFSAVYTEGLFLLLSVATVYAARLGRWRTAALIAVLAAATRSAGVLLLVPLAILYLYGPRADREPDRDPAGLRPRYLIRSDANWLVAVPIGLLAYVAYLGFATGDPLGAFSAQSEWHRILAPFASLPLGMWSAITAVIELFPNLGASDAGPFTSLADREAIRNLIMFGFLILGLWLVREAMRRLPAAYAAYAITSLALPLSVPVVSQPLMSLPRFMLLAFPLWIALALWALERDVLRRVLGASAVGLALSTVLFAGWLSAP